MNNIFKSVSNAILVFILSSFTLYSIANAYSSDQIMRSAVYRGGQAEKIARQIQTLLPELAAADDASMRKTVNNFYNGNITYTTDMSLYSVVDYWASPIESVARGRGDCEDYAIAKYFTLIAAGMPASKLRMVYVKADLPSGPEGHMVLAYYQQPNSEPYILDNLTNEVLLASRRSDLKPVFSFNTEGLWQGISSDSAGDPMVRISKWRDVVEKTKAEGF